MAATPNRSRRSRPAAAPPDAPVPREPPYEKLKRAILEGDLAPGQALVEAALAKRYGVSRTPIREGLRRLEQDGLVYRDSHGLVVRERSPGEILDLYDTRIVLESAAARVAAERRTDHDTRLLRWALNACQQVAETDNEAMVEANQRFHSTMWYSTHNESLIDLLERLNLHLVRYPGTTLAAPGRWAAATAEHEQILEAVERRDGEAAANIASVHFSAARDIRLELFARESGSHP